MAVLNPMKLPDATIMQDTDLAGPLVFCLMFGASLLLVSNEIRTIDSLKNALVANVHT